MITLSALSHVAACPGSATLPRYPRTSAAADLGTAIHALIERRVRDGGLFDLDALATAAAALDEDDAGRLAFLAAHLALDIPSAALAEVPLGYWSDGSVRRVEGGQGRYRDDGQILSGTVDAMWSEPYPPTAHEPDEEGVQRHPGRVFVPLTSTLWIADWKTGSDDYVPPIDRNWQLRAGALLAARWTGATRVIPAICYVNAAECADAVRAGRSYGGRWEVGEPLDLDALADIETELQQIHLAATEENPRYVLGPQCEWCDSRAACPAFTAQAVAMVGASEVEGATIKLTPERAAYLAGILPAIKRAHDAAEDAVRAHVEAFGPLTLADGKVLSRETEPTESFRTVEAFDVLAAEVGDAIANEAFVATKDRLKAALRKGRGVERLPRGAWDEVRAKIEARGGVVPGEREVWRRRWPSDRTVSQSSDQSVRRPTNRPVCANCAGFGIFAGEPCLYCGPGARYEISPRLTVETRQAERVASPPTGPAPSLASDGTGEGGERSKRRAACPVCERDVSVTADGLIRKHTVAAGALRCAGSGRLVAAPLRTVGMHERDVVPEDT